MSELRQDPFGGYWTIIASDRARRPMDLSPHSPPRPPPVSNCPLCPENENRTPGEIAAIRPPGEAANSPGWTVRVIPNLFPALQSESSGKGESEGLLKWVAGRGAHEVVVESPLHDRGLGDHSLQHLTDLLRVCRDRLRELMDDPDHAYVQLFKNHGEAAGASLTHPHIQILATPVCPDAINREANAFRLHQERQGGCLLCDLIRTEIESGRRVLRAGKAFIAMAPFASRVPFEILIAPRAHLESFQDLDPAALTSLAGILKEQLGRVKEKLQDPPYNLALHTAPNSRFRTGPYHWHLEILPRLVRLGGFEWGTGMYINPVPPEEAAKILLGTGTEHGRND